MGKMGSLKGKKKTLGGGGGTYAPTEKWSIPRKCKAF